MAEEKLEEIVENNELRALSIGLPMIPTVLVGTAAMALGQEYTAEHTNNIHGIVAAGMSAQVIARNPIYILSHLAFNRKRLIKDRKLDWKRTVQDAASFFASSKVGYFVWAGSCVAASEYFLYNDYSPIEAGALAGLITGSGYALFMSGLTPKIDGVIDYTKKGIRKFIESYVFEIIKIAGKEIKTKMKIAARLP